ncbi:MAG: DUF1289 domain-containing protein [Pseudomonadota bacterium]
MSIDPNLNTDSNENKIPSPCVRICSLNENDICLGCYRTLDEIISWSASSIDEKNLILYNCQKRRVEFKS